MGTDTFEIRARPNFSESLRTVYREGRQLARSGDLLQAVERWRIAANEVREPSSAWIRSWLFSRAAELFARARRWKEADDLYQSAIEPREGVSLAIRADLLEDWAKTLDDRRDWANAERYYHNRVLKRCGFR